MDLWRNDLLSVVSQWFKSVWPGAGLVGDLLSPVRGRHPASRAEPRVHPSAAFDPSAAVSAPSPLSGRNEEDVLLVAVVGTS
jgi:hypothetical protein